LLKKLKDTNPNPNGKSWGKGENELKWEEKAVAQGNDEITESEKKRLFTKTAGERGRFRERDCLL